MPRFCSPSNPYVHRITLCDGYELCARCGQPILNGDRAFVMWRSPEYGAFAHTFKCSNRKPRNWTKILTYEQINETLTWNSERVPGFVSPFNSQPALATLPVETRRFQYERVTGRKNRFEWTWTPGDPNWTRLDHWDEKGDWIPDGRVEIDTAGGLSSVVIRGITFPFVSLLDWAHIQNAASIVDIELSKEYPAKYPDLGAEHDGIPSSEEVCHRTAVAVHDGDDELGTAGLKPVVRRIVCDNREEKKMMARLGIRHLYDAVERAARNISYRAGEDGRESVGCMTFAYKPDCCIPKPEPLRMSFPKPIATRALERLIYATTVREERAKSYGTGRKVILSPHDWYFDGTDQRGQFPKDLTCNMRCFQPRKPKIKNGPGTAQSWDVFGQAVEYALYCDTGVRVMENGRWRKLGHAEYIEWETRRIDRTISDIPSFKVDPAHWKRILSATNVELAALVNYWAALGGSNLSFLLPAHDRPWQRIRREEDVSSLMTTGEDTILLPIVGDGFSVIPALEGA